MLEILLLVFLCRKIGAMVRAKGRTATGYQFMLVGLWVGGEFLGAFGAAFAMSDSGGPGLTIYLFALLGAAAGAGVTFVIVNALSVVPGYGQAPVRGYGFPVVPPAQGGGGGMPPPPMNPR